MKTASNWAASIPQSIEKSYEKKIIYIRNNLVRVDAFAKRHGRAIFQCGDEKPLDERNKEVQIRLFSPRSCLSTKSNKANFSRFMKRWSRKSIWSTRKLTR